MTIYVANNADSQLHAERQYMKKLLLHAQKGSSIDTILAEIIQYTKAKVVSRCRKILPVYDLSAANVLFDVNNMLHIGTEMPEYQQLEEQYRSRTDLDPSKSLVVALDAYLRHIGRKVISSEETLISDLVFIVQYAFESRT